MIHGVGTDIVAVDRLRRLIARYGQRIAEKILTPSELESFATATSPERFLAKRFAVKEAFAKAMGSGIRALVSWRAIGVDHDALGKPILICAEPLAAQLDARGLCAHVSVSDEAEYALAFVVIERRDRGD